MTVPNNAQVIEWNGATWLPTQLQHGLQHLNTAANSVAIANFGLAGKRIVVGGSYFDSIRSVGQLKSGDKVLPIFSFLTYIFLRECLFRHMNTLGKLRNFPCKSI